MNDPQAEGHMASYIRRRNFLATLLGGAAAWSLAARTQQPAMPLVRVSRSWIVRVCRESHRRVAPGPQANRIYRRHHGIEYRWAATIGCMRWPTIKGRLVHGDDAGPRVDIIGRFQPLAQLVAHRAQRSGRRLPSF